MSTNLPVYYQDAARKRTGEVADADWDDGMNKGGSCACGLGINTGAVSTPRPEGYTLLDQAEVARDPQDGQHIGGASTPLNVVQGADINDTVHYITATQQAVADAVYDVTSGAVNQTGETVEIGDVVWGTVPVA